MTDHYANPRDPRLLAQCAKIHEDAVPCKVWSPEGTYFTATCATHEEIAGNLVASGMPQEEYWPQVVAGYRATVRGYIEQVRAHRKTKQEATHQALDMIAKVQMTNDGQWTFGNGVRYPTALGAAYAAVKSLLNEGEQE